MYCRDCTRKHLGQALVLLHEARFGYPDHLWLAVGHLAEAERECCRLDTAIATRIREIRKALEADLWAEDSGLLTIIGELDVTD